MGSTGGGWFLMAGPCLDRLSQTRFFHQKRVFSHFGEWENFPCNYGCYYFLFHLFLTSLNFAMMVGLWNEFLVTKSPGQLRCWSPKNGSLEAFLYNHLANFEGYPWKKQHNPFRIRHHQGHQGELAGWFFYTSTVFFCKWGARWLPMPPMCVGRIGPAACMCDHEGEQRIYVTWPVVGSVPGMARTNNCLAWGKRRQKGTIYARKCVCVIWLYSVFILLHTWCEFIYCTYLYALPEREEAQLYNNMLFTPLDANSGEQVGIDLYHFLLGSVPAWKGNDQRCDIVAWWFVSRFV